MTTIDTGLPVLNGGVPNRETRRAAGFRRQRRQFRLRFEDDSQGLLGLVATVNSVSVGSMLELVELADMADEVTVEGLKAVGDLFAMFAGALVEWNLEEEDGTPVPTTVAGVKSLDMDQAMALVKKWMEAAAGVAGPLGPTSTGGEPSAVLDLPMEPLSESPGS